MTPSSMRISRKVEAHRLEQALRLRPARRRRGRGLGRLRALGWSEQRRRLIDPPRPARSRPAAAGSRPSREPRAPASRSRCPPGPCARHGSPAGGRRTPGSRRSAPSCCLWTWPPAGRPGARCGSGCLRCSGPTAGPGSECTPGKALPGRCGWERVRSESKGAAETGPLTSSVPRPPAARRHRDGRRPPHRPGEVVDLRPEVAEGERRPRPDRLVDERGRARRQDGPLDAGICAKPAVSASMSGSRAESLRVRLPGRPV